MSTNGGPWAVETPPERPADPAVRRANMRRVMRLFRPYGMRLGAVLSLIVLSAGLDIVSPFLLKAILDTALPERDNALLTLLVGGMIGIAIVTGILGVYQTLLSNQVGQLVMHDLRSAVYRHLQRLSLAFFTRTRTGEVQARIASDIGGVQSVVTSTATSIVANVTTVLASIVAMFALDWRLAVLSLGLLPFFILLTRRVGAQRKEITTTRQRTIADMSSIVAGVPVGLGDPAREDHGPLRGAGDALPGRVRAPRRPRGAPADGRPLDDGLDRDDVRDHARRRLLVRRPEHRAGRPSRSGPLVAFTTLQTRLFFPISRC